MVTPVVIWDPTGSAMRGVLPVRQLKFSLAAGGGGDVSFTALASDMDALGAWDSIAVLDTGGSHPPAYAIRPPHVIPRTGKPVVQVRAMTITEQWASETVLLPEYGGGKMPRGAGEERALGWQGSAYNPATDPYELWGECYNTGRSSSTLPPNFPSGTGAKWISVAGATDVSERKLFRAWLDLRGHTGPQLLEIFLASDEPATLYVAGEPVLTSTSIEGHKDPAYKEPPVRAQMVAQPGLYAVAVDCMTSITKGGDGVDPIILAIGLVDDDGDVGSWVLVTDAADWVACRRDDEFPGDQAPGPVQGALIADLHGEAKARGAAFGMLALPSSLATTDSYGFTWTGTVIERQYRYGSDSYWSILAGLAETGEVDIWSQWIGPGAKLQAAPMQGRYLADAITLGAGDIQTMSETRGSVQGNWLVGLSHTGWHYGGLPGVPRREYMIELGTARSPAIAHRIGVASLNEHGRWDGSARVRSRPGARPHLDYQPGDWIGCDYPDAPPEVRVLSISAEAGEGAMLWDLELTVEATP